MISQEDLENLIGDLESDRVERTRATKDTDKFSIAVCAFANDMPDHRRPGYLIIGVDDEGRPTGLDVTDNLLQALAALRSDGNILPMPSINVGKYQLPGGDVAVVEVQPMYMPPVRYKGQVWIRVGPRRGIANEEEERRLSERRADRPNTWDAQACAEARLEDLDLAYFDYYRRKAVADEVIANNHRTIKEQLAALRFYDLRTDHPTNAGILLFGKDPPYYHPGAWTQCLRFPGTSKGELPSNALPPWRMNLVELLQKLDSWIKLSVTHRLRKVEGSAIREETRTDYPEWAVRELALNALMHRDYMSTAPVRVYWYSDRIEVDNPGGPYGQMTPETFGQGSAYRNPILAEAFRTLGFVNRFGFGIQAAKDRLYANGNPPPIFDVQTNWVHVTIPAAPLPAQ